MMPDREKLIKHFEHLLNAAKGNYQDFVDLTVDVGEEILFLLKEQEGKYYSEVFDVGYKAGRESIVRCKDCKNADYGTDEDGNRFMKCIGSVRCYGGTTQDWFCADGERKEGR